MDCFKKERKPHSITIPNTSSFPQEHTSFLARNQVDFRSRTNPEATRTNQMDEIV